MTDITNMRDRWRVGPTTKASFHQVASFLPTAKIMNDPDRVWSIETAPKAWRESIIQRGLLRFTHTDALVILHEGRLVYEYYANGNSPGQPHILMSCSKAVMGLLLGSLVANRRIDETAPIELYAPELSDTRYAGATARDLADMRAGVILSSSEQALYDVATNWEPARVTPAEANLKSFFSSLKGAPAGHGGPFRYVSSHTDLLGWIIERATGQSIADLVGEWLWRPLGAEAAGYLTRDQDGLGRTAGGFGFCARDFARLGLLLLRGGRREDRQVIPRAVVDDLWINADRAAWTAGAWADTLAPVSRQMAYRAGWYVVDEAPRRLFAMGIHGQNLFLDRDRGLVVAKFSSWPQASAPLPFVITHRAIARLQNRLS